MTIENLPCPVGRGLHAWGDSDISHGHFLQSQLCVEDSKRFKRATTAISPTFRLFPLSYLFLLSGSRKKQKKTILKFFLSPLSLEYVI
jgi:hypothetical protein